MVSSVVAVLIAVAVAIAVLIAVAVAIAVLVAVAVAIAVLITAVVAIAVLITAVVTIATLVSIKGGAICESSSSRSLFPARKFIDDTRRALAACICSSPCQKRADDK